MSKLRDGLSCPRLSVAMIVRNEQDVLAATLESVATLADQLVVLDTGSRDDTPNIARRFGAEVHHADWRDDFAAARNACLRHANGHWVLWLDAGERFDPAAIGGFRAFVDHRADSLKAYALAVESPPWRIVQPRLMPNRADLRFVGRVRETLDSALQSAEMFVEDAPGRIFGRGGRMDSAAREHQANRNLALVRAELAETRRRTPRLVLVLAEALGVLGHLEQSREFFLEAAASAERGSAEQLEAYLGAIRSYGDATELQPRKLSACLHALESFPFDATLLLAMGHCLRTQHRDDLAIKSYEAAVKFGQMTANVWHLADVKEQAAAALETLRRRSDSQPPRHLRIDCGESPLSGPTAEMLGWKLAVEL